MKDVLDQSQIDALLDDVLGGKVEIADQTDAGKKKVKEYDFKIPKKFTKDQLRTVVGVFEIYARHLSSYMTGTLRTFCQVEVLTIEETKYYEYANAMPESALLGILDLNPSEGTIVMELSKDLGFTIIDKLLGGQGNGEILDREYSDIEMALLERFYKNIISFLKDAWANVAEIDPVFRKFENKNSISRIMHLDDVVVIVVLNAKIKDISGTVTVCLPFDWLESINEKLYTKYRMTERSRSNMDTDTAKQAIFSHINKAGIDVVAILGSATIQLKELLGMEPGDVIRLNQKQQDYVKVAVDNRTWFYGRLGTMNHQKAVEIVKSIE